MHRVTTRETRRMERVSENHSERQIFSESFKGCAPRMVTPAEL